MYESILQRYYDDTKGGYKITVIIIIINLFKQGNISGGCEPSPLLYNCNSTFNNKIGLII